MKKRNIEKVMENILLGFETEQEKDDFVEALSITSSFTNKEVTHKIYEMSVLMYEYGKTVGIRKERALRKKLDKY